MQQDAVEPKVLTTIADGVATVLLNRPDTRNAWSPAMETAYFDALQAASDDPAVRVIVVAGAGGSFSVGPELGEIAPDRLAEFERDPRGDAFATTLPKPVVAAIDGPCVGIGLSVALMCDIRFASARAKLTTGFARIGLIAEHGTSWLLQRVASPAVALDLLLSSRIVRGDEAQRLGLVNFVVEDDVLAAAQEYARAMAVSSSPSAMAVIKAQVHADATTSLGDAVAEADRLVELAAATPDFAAAITAMIEGRKPEHQPLAAEAVR